MVCDAMNIFSSLRVYAVLILILLEYGLRHKFEFRLDNENDVLILILLEYGLRHCRENDKGNLCAYVLILILLEYGLRLLKSQTIDFQTLKT